MVKYLFDDQNVNIDLFGKFFRVHCLYELLKNVILFELNLKLFCLFNLSAY
jgi:hypothetical protein